MKKLTALLLCLAVVLSLAACGSKNNAPDSGETPNVPDEAAPADTPDPGNTDGETGKTLVVYFSAGGNTRRVAEAIAAAASADLFEIIPAEPYTAADLNYNDSSSRVSREHEDDSLRNVALSAVTPENWSDYNTVFVGYPIWWGIAAWPVSSFVAGNDFEGKTVIPFATSASSGLGSSASELFETANGGTWLDGQRFPSGVSDEEVHSWVKELNLQ